MSDEITPAPEVERPLDPEAIAEARAIVADVTALIDSGDLEQIAVYVGRRNGQYQTLSNRNNGRHEDAGRILEFALHRLGFVQREDVADLIGES
jgi:hypothetical protein